MYNTRSKEGITSFLNKINMSASFIFVYLSKRTKAHECDPHSHRRVKLTVSLLSPMEAVKQEATQPKPAFLITLLNSTLRHNNILLSSPPTRHDRQHAATTFTTSHSTVTLLQYPDCDSSLYLSRLIRLHNLVQLIC